MIIIIIINHYVHLLTIITIDVDVTPDELDVDPILDESPTLMMYLCLLSPNQPDGKLLVGD